MRAEFPNGSSVNRVWESAGEVAEAELIAMFQYESDATSFAKAKLAEERARELRAFFVVSCAYSGRVTILRQPNPDEAKSQESRP